MNLNNLKLSVLNTLFDIYVILSIFIIIFQYLINLCCKKIFNKP